MRKNNREIFDELPADIFLKTGHSASSVFRMLEHLQNAIGFDDESEGFLVIHRGHAPSAFDKEIPVCLILKKLGFRVILDYEEPSKGSADAQIDGEKFEIKQVSKARNIRKAVIYQFRNTYSKSKRLLLHIDQPANAEQLRGALFEASRIYPKIEVIWVVFHNQLYQFSKEKIKNGKHQFQPKK